MYRIDVPWDGLLSLEECKRVIPYLEEEIGIGCGSRIFGVHRVVLRNWRAPIDD